MRRYIVEIRLRVNCIRVGAVQQISDKVLSSHDLNTAQCRGQRRVG